VGYGAEHKRPVDGKTCASHDFDVSVPSPEPTLMDRSRRFGIQLEWATNVWNDKRVDPGDRRIHRSLRLISVAFWVLAAFLCVASLRGLVLRNRPQHTLFGIAFMGLTAAVMLSLSVLKRRTAQKIPSETLLAESALTLFDGCLATSVLIALVLNDALGWWWADAIAALVVAAFALSEGVRHWMDSAPHESIQT